MFEPIHFYVVFNPLLNKHENGEWTQAHDFYLLLKKYLERGYSEYLYWGKLLIDRNQPSLDIPKFQYIHLRNQNNRRNTHLFISDFNSLWVGKVEGIEKKIGDEDLTLPFYKGKEVEIWFKITDMTLLTDNNLETNEYLQRFSMDHEFYQDFSGDKTAHLNPYTHSLRYPLLVKDPQDMEHFSHDGEKKLVMQNDPQIFQRSSKKVLNNLHTYTIPREFFSRIPKLARNEILNSELEIFNQKVLWPVRIAKSYIKALDLTLNDLFVWHLKQNVSAADSLFVDCRDPSAPRFVPHDEAKDLKNTGTVIKLMDFRLNFSMKNIFDFLDADNPLPQIPFDSLFREKWEFFHFLKSEFRETVKKCHLMEIRDLKEESPEANEMSLSEAMAIRNVILGVGCYGLINQLIGSYYRYQVGSLFKKMG